MFQFVACFVYFDFFASEEDKQKEETLIDSLQNIELIIVGVGILLGSLLLMLLFGLAFTMPRKYKNFVRAYGDEEEFLKRMQLTHLWMNIFYAAYYPIMLLVLLAMGAYIFGFGILHSDEVVSKALNLLILILSLDWVIWELLFNLSQALCVSCAVKKGNQSGCWCLAVFGDCMKGYRNATL